MIKIEFSTDNAAFHPERAGNEETREVERILKELANKIGSLNPVGERAFDSPYHFFIRDSGGEHIGDAWFSAEFDPEDPEGGHRG